MDNYRKKILDLITASKEYDLKSASIMLGKSHSYLHQFIHRDIPRKLDGDDRRKLAMMLKVPESELLPDGASADDIKAIAIYDASDQDEAKIPVYDVQASAGNGCVVDHERILYHLSFRKEWLRAVSRAPLDKLAVIRIEGDSMQPTLSHDDTVLIDMTQTFPRSDGIYVLVYDDTLMAKRVRIDPVRNKASIVSDNPLYPIVEGLAPEEIRIAGKVLWLGRRV